MLTNSNAGDYVCSYAGIKDKDELIKRFRQAIDEALSAPADDEVCVCVCVCVCVHACV